MAHVIAAAAPAGKEAADLAIVVKLTRVAMLIPAAVILGSWEGYRQRKQGSAAGTAEEPCARRKKVEWKKLPVQWFILGFLLISGVNTLGIIRGRRKRTYCPGLFFCWRWQWREWDWA
ncbi:putative sulfate exporter family transporter [Paenibacillus sp. S150]|uniref:putative sulfate exporter family transporter n=1 Tax=Paenibacillus sp. S150 TaxID=2749826 RepID=UPI001C592DC0|nr:putative sulfate exporter family transporter [Paenibacillus sp. S150]